MALVFVPKETAPGETRVAATPETVGRLRTQGLDVAVESGAGAAAAFSDAAYAQAGARAGQVADWGKADLVLKVQAPSPAEAASTKSGAVLVALMAPAQNASAIEVLRDRRVSTLAMDLIPRISRAQPMDALSSQATVAGYKAVLLGAVHMGKLCPLLMTAAGTIPPARVVVFGAGVAGLQAIATAKRLGCSVEATDVRLAAREQVLSLGARFIDVPGMEDMEGKGGYAKEATPEFLERQRQEVRKRVAEADLVITTAQIPGRPAPRLVDEAMLESMRQGAVLVDLAVESGGNCALSVPGEVVRRKGVTLVGLRNLPASVPTHASELYAKNVLALVKLFMGKDGALARDFKDEVLAGCLLTHAGEIAHAPTAEALAVKGART
jgi:NAD(P) transhydrogenase subunit alpha